MKVLFAVSNESVSESIIKKYQQMYKEIILSKNVYSLNKITNINFKSITVDDGLSQSLAEYIYQDSFGYIWIGTENGLNRYNGNDFKVSINSNDLKQLLKTILENKLNNNYSKKNIK